MKVEAPPGFEPGVEVLQTSALPLGDGADETVWLARREVCRRASGATARPLAPGSPTAAHAPVGTRERRLERETGFEPATSTLARSHSTTELFPLERSTYHHSRTERKTLAASSGAVGLM